MHHISTLLIWINRVGWAGDACHWQDNVFASGNKGAANSGPRIFSHIVIPDFLEMRTLVPSVEHQLWSLLDWDDLSVDEAHRRSLFLRKFFGNHFNAVINRIPELHALAAASENGNPGKAIRSFDKGARATHSCSHQQRCVSNISWIWPVVAQDFCSLSVATKKCCDIFAELKKEK